MGLCWYHCKITTLVKGEYRSKTYLTPNFYKQVEEYKELEKSKNKKKEQKKSKATGKRRNANVIDDASNLNNFDMDLLNNITIPHCTYCGSTNFTENLMITPATYDFYTNDNSIDNLSTHFCTCLECHRAFSYKG